MKYTKLTLHARKRITERSMMSRTIVSKLMRDNATVVFSFMKGAKFSKHLIYSEKNDSYYIAVVKTDGPMLTFMPEEYSQERDFISSEHKTEAKRLAIEWRTNREKRKREKAAAKVEEAIGSGMILDSSKTGIWIAVNYQSGTVSKFVTLGKSPSDIPPPSNWGSSTSPIHQWVKAHLELQEIHPVSVNSFMIRYSKKDEWRYADALLENMILTPEEVLEIQKRYV